MADPGSGPASVKPVSSDETPETPTTTPTGVATDAEPTGPAQGTGLTDPTPTGPTEPTAPPVADPLRGSRTSGVWVGTVGLGLLLVLLVVFITQNTAKTSVRFLVWEGQASVAIVILVAVAAGILLTAIAGSLRILQLRRRTRKARKAERKRR